MFAKMLNVIKTLLSDIMKLLASLFGYAWKTLLFLINLIDGGKQNHHEEIDPPINYNYRTGKADPHKRIDGLYDSDQ